MLAILKTLWAASSIFIVGLVAAIGVLILTIVFVAFLWIRVSILVLASIAVLSVEAWRNKNGRTTITVSRIFASVVSIVDDGIDEVLESGIKKSDMTLDDELLQPRGPKKRK